MSRIYLAIACILLSAWAWAGPAEDFAALIEEFDAFELANDPIRAGREGDLEALGRWPDASIETIAARQQTQAKFHERLQAIPEQALDDSDRVSHAVLDYILRSRVALAAFEPQRISFTNDSGFFSSPLTVAAIEETVLPAYRDLLKFFEEEYTAGARESLSISEVPRGRDYYRALVWLEPRTG